MLRPRLLARRRWGARVWAGRGCPSRLPGAGRRQPGCRHAGARHFDVGGPVAASRGGGAALGRQRRWLDGHHQRNRDGGFAAGPGALLSPEHTLRSGHCAGGRFLLSRLARLRAARRTGPALSAPAASRALARFVPQRFALVRGYGNVDSPAGEHSRNAPAPEPHDSSPLHLAAAAAVGLAARDRRRAAELSASLWLVGGHPRIRLLLKRLGWGAL